MTETINIEIHPIEKSRIDAVDFDNLVFGRSFADHMLVVDYKDGAWQTPQIVPYGNLSYSPAMMSLHYGQAIFEGMKAYKSESGDILVFRPLENWARLNKSAVRMCIPEIPEEIFMGGLSELLRLDANWIPDKPGCSMYIRPFIFSTDEYVGVSPSKTYKFIIFNCPVGAYYSKPLKVRVETQYIRAAHGGVGFSKNAGNYGGSLYPTKLANDAGYDQIIWTDAAEHKYVEEAGTMNLMFVINGALVTAPTGDTILDGITRKSVLQVAHDWGMKVEERKLSIEELVNGIKDGSVQEAFGAGTAAVIAPISTIGFEGNDYVLPERPEDAFSRRVYEEINNIKIGKKEDTHGWVYKV
ncbi:branched chain amino acid aminotransferase apoenzyme [Pseudarcicella hirudinis]|uniref:branched-chain-amino-acid transaminase n=1 Tax=Pseudarcicella hirudinis TaxID=1079859 RepID=A0A1I5Z3J0_9BACT|nr:branched-chain amino acid aminotransferase [Pseudarcicella hirudinis]SFQ51021.1 branched chain amino acid aminotransferase apoenzyme [Pseudarcicella hirudinis]